MPHNVASLRFRDTQLVYDVDRNTIYRASGRMRDTDQSISITPEPLSMVRDSVAGLRFSVVNIIPTHRCNLRCTYCYAAPARRAYRGPGFMSTTTLRRAVDTVLDRQPEVPIVRFTGGGEPMLDMERFRAYIDLLRSDYLSTVKKVEVSTNGSTLSRQTIEYLSDNDILMKISYDGAEVANKTNRGLGESVLELLMSSTQFDALSDRVTIAITITNRNLRIFDYVRTLHENGFRRVRFQLALDKKQIVRSDRFHELQDEIEKLFHWYLQIRSAGNPFVVDNIEDHVRQLRSRVYWRRHMTTCMAGINELAVSPDGDFFTCPRMANYDDLFRIGSVCSGVDPQAVDRVVAIMSIEEKERCQTCWLGHLCRGLCNYALRSLTGSYQAVDEDRCAYLKLIYTGAMWYLSETGGNLCETQTLRKY